MTDTGLLSYNQTMNKIEALTNSAVHENRSTILRDGVGERLSKLRGSANLTQEQLAVMAGISTSALSRFERGVVEARLSTLRVISETLGARLQRPSIQILFEIVSGGEQ